jgi:hypothetical protein
MYLVGIGFLSSQAVSRVFKENKSFVLFASGLMSFVMLSQFWLENYLRWGFMSSGLVVLVCIALYNVLTSGETPSGLSVFYVLVTILVVLATFPIMVGAVIGLAFGQIILAIRGEIITFKDKTVLILGLILPSIVLLLITSHLPFQGFVQDKLNLDGATAVMNADFIIYFVFVFAIMILMGTDLVVRVAVSGLSLSLSTLVIDKYLDHVLTATYYLQKFRWLSIFVMSIIFCTCLVSIYVETKNRTLRVTVASLCVLSPLLFTTPILQKFSSKNLVKSMVSSWEYPTMQEAQTVIEINATTPRAVLWQISPNYLATQIMNMWLMTGLEEIRNKSDLVLWTYNSDQFSLQTICEFATVNKPVTIWVPTPEVKKFVSGYCNNSNVNVRALSKGI